MSTPAGFRDAYDAFVGVGWGSMATPKLAGGDGMPLVVATAAREFWSAANFTLALCPSLSEGAVWAIAGDVRHAGCAQRRRNRVDRTQTRHPCQPYLCAGL